MTGKRASRVPLDLEETRVTDAGPAHLKGLTRLTTIRLHQTGVTAAGATVPIGSDEGAETTFGEGQALPAARSNTRNSSKSCEATTASTGLLATTSASRAFGRKCGGFGVVGCLGVAEIGI